MEVSKLTPVSKPEAGCLFWTATLSYLTTKLLCFTNHRTKGERQLLPLGLALTPLDASCPPALRSRKAWGNWREDGKSGQRRVKRVSPLSWQRKEAVSHIAFSYRLLCLGFFLQWYQTLRFSESSRNGWAILTGQTSTTQGISAGIGRYLELPRRKNMSFLRFLVKRCFWSY